MNKISELNINKVVMDIFSATRKELVVILFNLGVGGK